MKNVLLFALALVLTGPGIMSQPLNKEINSNGKSPSLLGKINKEGLSGEHYASWFTKNFDAYTPKQNHIDSLEALLPKYTITAFMGTWCGDSKRQVPNFYKVLSEANFPLERLTMVAVSRDRETYKQSPGGEQEGLNIHRVPTFIIYKNGKEVNRIVEKPVTTLENDLLHIIQKNYTSNYHGVTLVNELLTEVDTRSFNRKQKRLLPELKKAVKGTRELNTYASVLFSAHRKEESIIAARINTLLFPEEASAYNSLANKLAMTNKNKEALENYEKALSIDPDNKRAKSGIAQIKSE
ncbi:MAG: tetratricopeptide repeat protein [Bacteroidota bacterium]